MLHETNQAASEFTLNFVQIWQLILLSPNSVVCCGGINSRPVSFCLSVEILYKFVVFLRTNRPVGLCGRAAEW